MHGLGRTRRTSRPILTAIPRLWHRENLAGHRHNPERLRRRTPPRARRSLAVQTAPWPPPTTSVQHVPQVTIRRLTTGSEPTHAPHQTSGSTPLRGPRSGRCCPSRSATPHDSRRAATQSSGQHRTVNREGTTPAGRLHPATHLPQESLRTGACRNLLAALRESLSKPHVQPVTGARDRLPRKRIHRLRAVCGPHRRPSV
ncbi:MAG: hypothetical protein QOE58_3121 [Actinomycetota bacterium]|nr:hypothetical protein [Actinomycetota bacterium]